MKKLLLGIFFLCLPAAVLAAAPAIAAPAAGDYDGFLIALEDAVLLSADAPEGAAALEYVARDVYRTDDAALAAELLETGRARYVEPNYTVSLFSLEEDADWSYETVGGDDAHALGLDGDGVRIAIIDSGVDKDNINLSGANFGEGHDYLTGSAEMTDTVGHGTYVCQIIAGSGTGGVTGVAGAAELIPLRCFSASRGSVSDIIAAIYDAVDVYHCDIINMSWGLPTATSALKEALLYAYDTGTILVAAAGNAPRAGSQGTLYYPAAFREVIGVGSVDRTRHVSAGSQQTAAVYVCAPGEGIVLSSLSGTTVSESGTSFAAPYLTAELALLKQLAPGFGAEDALALLRERAVDLGDTGYDTAYGYGFADISALLGQSWCAAETTETGFAFSGWFRNEGGGYIITALYDPAGKMADCSLLDFDTPIRGFAFRLETKAAVAKLFFTDRAFTPRAENVIVTA